MVHTVGQKHVTCNSKAEPGPNPGPLPSRTCQIPHATKYTQLESRWLHLFMSTVYMNQICLFLFSRLCSDVVFANTIELITVLGCMLLILCSLNVRRDLLLPSNNLDCIRLHAVDWSSFQFTSSSSVCTSACRSMLWLWHVRHHSSSKFKTSLINVDVIGLSNCQSPSRTSA